MQVPSPDAIVSLLSPAVAPAPPLPCVLLVEEHDEMRSALRDWLLTSCAPLKLREARSMDEALRLAGQASLDLALINLELPGPNGIEATRLMRKRHPACRVVVMSVNESSALRIAALSAGAEAFVCKRDLRIALHPILATLRKPAA
jgi:DNA-binding NarL/FixJ family response regulator